MKLRSFATLLVCAALAACEGDTTLPVPQLTGQWKSNNSSIIATFPDGSRPVLGHVELHLESNGQFRREVRYQDPVNGIGFYDAITEGTYTVSEQTVEVTITHAYHRLGGTPVPGPTLLPVPPRAETFTYSLEGNQLTFSYRCDPASLALCIPDPFPHYTRREAEG